MKIFTSRNNPSDNILGPYKRYYRLMTDRDLEDKGFTREDVDDTLAMEDFGIRFLGTADLDPSKVEMSTYKHLEDAAYDMLSVGQDESGNIGLYLVPPYGERPILISLDEIEDELEYDGYVEDDYYGPGEDW